MALPELISLVPPEGPVVARVAVPGSKSITNRALVLGALGEGERVLQGALWSEDTQVMVECLQELGFMVNVEPDPQEPCNRTITIYGQGGRVPRGGSPTSPLDLFVGNAGTAARFLSALVCLGHGCYRLSGVERMHQRPQGALFEALRQLGYVVDSTNNRLPAIVHGSGPRAGACRVSIEESSQFASALLLCSSVGGWRVSVVGENTEESPYIRMTAEMLKRFGEVRGVFPVEADASSGSYFLAADWLLSTSEKGAATPISVARWPSSGWQIDEAFPQVIARCLGVRSELASGEPSSHTGRSASGTISRATDLGDSIMTAIVMAPFAAAPVHFTDLGRLRLQECERVSALRTELTKCSGQIVEEHDSLTVYPSSLHGAEIETYGDHRMAMCFAVLAVRVPGIKLRGPACVKKTFPDFFQKLAALPPAGLGVRVLDSGGQPVTAADLFAV